MTAEMVELHRWLRAKNEAAERRQTTGRAFFATRGLLTSEDRADIAGLLKLAQMPEDAS
jgi:hypothetical protein